MRITFDTANDRQNSLNFDATGTFGVWCEVWGGRTGHRANWAHDAGRVLEFNTREEAEALAREYTSLVHRNMTASFSYEARPITD